MEIMQLVAGALSLVAAAIGLPTIITFLLGKKNANRKLDMEEVSVEVDVFSEQRQAYKDIIDSCRSEVADLRARVSDLAQAQAADRLVTQEYRNKLDRVRRLFLQFTKRVGFPMTPEEQAEFEATKPARLRRA